MLILVHSPLPHPYYRTTSRNCFHCCILWIGNSSTIVRDLWKLLEISNQVIFYSFKMLTLPSSSLTTLTLGTLILSHTPCLIASFVITSHLSCWPTSSSSSSLSYLQLAAQLSQLHARLKPYLLRREKEVVEKSVPPKEEVTPLVLWDCIYYPPLPPSFIIYPSSSPVIYHSSPPYQWPSFPSLLCTDQVIIDVELTVPQKQYYRAIYEMNTSFLFKVCINTPSFFYFLQP